MTLWNSSNTSLLNGPSDIFVTFAVTFYTLTSDPGCSLQWLSCSQWLSVTFALCSLTMTFFGHPYRDCCALAIILCALQEDCSLSQWLSDLPCDLCALMIMVWSLQWLFLTLTMTVSSIMALCVPHCGSCVTFHDFMTHTWIFEASKTEPLLQNHFDLTRN